MQNVAGRAGRLICQMRSRSEARDSTEEVRRAPSEETTTRTAGAAVMHLINLRAGLADDLCPALLLRAKKGGELGRRRAHDLDAGGGHVRLYFAGRERADELALQ